MNSPRADAQQRWRRRCSLASSASQSFPAERRRQADRMVGLTLEASGCLAAVGDRCEIVGADNKHLEAEVVGFSGERLFLMPTGDIHGLKPDARVLPIDRAGTVAVGPKLLAELSMAPASHWTAWVDSYRDQRAIDRHANQPLARKPISQPLDVGVRAINGLLTVGRGQRIGYSPEAVLARACCSA